MTDDATFQRLLQAIADLIDGVLGALAGDQSASALQCEIQARAALDALQAASGRAWSHRHDSDGAARPRPVHRDEAASLLAAAEDELAALPTSARNQVAVCAAASYLRGARRALAQR